jgi:voltage-gated potassium channel Kch
LKEELIPLIASRPRATPHVTGTFPAAMQRQLSLEIIRRFGWPVHYGDASRMDLLRTSKNTQSDLACPHGVQFYDLVDAAGAQQTRRLVLRGAASGDAASRSLDRLLGGRRDHR